MSGCFIQNLWKKYSVSLINLFWSDHACKIPFTIWLDLLEFYYSLRSDIIFNKWCFEWHECFTDQSHALHYLLWHNFCDIMSFHRITVVSYDKCIVDNYLTLMTLSPLMSRVEWHEQIHRQVTSLQWVLAIKCLLVLHYSVVPIYIFWSFVDTVLILNFF